MISENTQMGECGGVTWEKVLRYLDSKKRGLDTLYHFEIVSSPLIYQGDEIGMTNTVFDRIEDYNDRYTVGEYRERRNAGMSHEEALFQIRMASRDNARTPMLLPQRVLMALQEGRDVVPSGIKYRIHSDSPEKATDHPPVKKQSTGI